MPPASRVLPRHIAEPPQDGAPYGRWAARLQSEFLAAAQDLAVGEPGPVTFFPDRSWHGRTYIPASCMTDQGNEIYGYVAFVPATDGGEPQDFRATADSTEDTAERNPDWALDICDEVIGSWRGEGGKVAAITLLWGRVLRPGGVVATAELGSLAVDQCTLDEDRFTLVAPDDYGGDLLEVRIYDKTGEELARESLYAEE